VIYSTRTTTNHPLYREGGRHLPWRHRPVANHRVTYSTHVSRYQLNRKRVAWYCLTPLGKYPAGWLVEPASNPIALRLSRCNDTKDDELSRCIRWPDWILRRHRYSTIASNLSVAWSVRLSHSCTLLKSLVGMRCHLAGTLTWPQETTYLRGSPPRGKKKTGCEKKFIARALYSSFVIAS